MVFCEPINVAQQCLLNYDGRCKHPSAPPELDDYNACMQDKAPEACPLRKGALLVQLGRAGGRAPNVDVKGKG